MGGRYLLKLRQKNYSPQFSHIQWGKQLRGYSQQHLTVKFIGLSAGA